MWVARQTFWITPLAPLREHNLFSAMRITS